MHVCVPNYDGLNLHSKQKTWWLINYLMISWKLFPRTFQTRSLHHFCKNIYQILLVLNIRGCLDARSPCTTFLGEENVCSVLSFYMFEYFNKIKTMFLNCAAADVLLWRNKKISGGFLAGATVIWVLFEWLNYHFLTMVCFGLVLAMLAQFLWANASGFLNRYITLIPSFNLPWCVGSDTNTLFYISCPFVTGGDHHQKPLFLFCPMS